MFNEATFREALLQSSGNVTQWWDKYLSLKILVKLVIIAWFLTLTSKVQKYTMNEIILYS